MDSVTESQMSLMFSADVEVFGIFESALVSIRCAVKQKNPFICWYFDPMQTQGVRRLSSEELDRGLEAYDLFNCGGEQA
jgi:hypothetical protein